MKLIIMVIILCLPISSISSVPTITKGKNRPVCAEYLKSLDTSKLKIGSCGFHLNDLHGLSTPDWEMLTLTDGEYFAHFNEFGEWLWNRDANPIKYTTVAKMIAWSNNRRDIANSKHFYLRLRENLFWMINRTMYISSLDIDNNGFSELVYYEKNCHSASRIAVLTDKLRLDAQKTEEITFHDRFDKKGTLLRKLYSSDRLANQIRYKKAKLVPIESPVNSIRYNIFLYKGKTYIDQWWRNNIPKPIHPGLLKVFTIQKGKRKLVCEFQIRQQ